jgi:hypothetical protein
VKRHWRLRLHDIVFENDTPAGKAFDVAVLVSILLSVFTVLLESVGSIRLTYGTLLRAAEWTFTILFTVEYILRLACVSRPVRYALSFFGIVDLLAVVPTYLSLARNTNSSGYPGSTAAARLPGTQTWPLYRCGALSECGDASKSSENHRIPMRGTDDRDYHRSPNVSD